MPRRGRGSGVAGPFGASDLGWGIGGGAAREVRVDFAAEAPTARRFDQTKLEGVLTREWRFPLDPEARSSGFLKNNAPRPDGQRASVRRPEV